MKHLLKTWPDFFQEVKKGAKNFEVRKDDRNFQIGDTLELQEYDLEDGYSGDSIERVVTYKLIGGDFGIEQGHCVLGLKNNNQ